MKGTDMPTTDKIAAKIGEAKATIASKTSGSYTELQDIREDLESLKNNVVELTRHLQTDGTLLADKMAKKAKLRAVELKDAGREEMYRIEDRVREHPSQSIAVAFLAGVVASFLFGGRRD